MEAATLAPATDAQMAIAVGRWAGGKTVARMDSVPGMISAAAHPITARAASSSPVPGANAPIAAATA